MFKNTEKLVKIVIVCFEVKLMFEKLNDILFHPSRLSQFKNTKFYKVFFYLIFLSLFSITVLIIDTVKNPEITIADKDIIEQSFNINFNVANNLPDCSLRDNTYSCIDEQSSNKEILTILGMVYLISDVNDKVTRFNTIKLTENKVVINMGIGNRYTISYDKLPKGWQEFDFTEIKNASNPQDEFYKLFMIGYNELVYKLIPFMVLSNIIISFIIKTLEILFYALLFTLLYRRFNFKFGELFKLTVFAQTLPITISVILDLLNVKMSTVFLSTFLTFIYVYFAVVHSIPSNREF